MDVHYCPKCATALVWQFSGDRERPTCPSCGFVFYFNPIVGAGALVEIEDGVVLVRRGVGPEAGRWSLPAGYVEADELAEDAAVREMQEETGLQIEIDELLGVYSFGREPQTGVLILYSAHRAGGELRAGDDAQEVRAFAPDALPPDEEIAFRTHRQALHDWRRARAIIYRKATDDDRQALAELSKHQPQVGEVYLDYVTGNDRELLVAWGREQIVGIACVSYRPRDRSANIDQVYVHPSYRRWGIATRLVNQAIVCARQRSTRTIFAQAPVTNPVLLVYLKAGFRVSGFLDTYLPPGGEGPVTALYLAYDLA